MLSARIANDRAGRLRRFAAAIGLTAVAAFGVAGLAGNTTAAGPNDYWVLPAAAVDPAVSGTQRVILAGGCFWGIQAVYQHINGVLSAVSGYAGGNQADATYARIQTGQTGHAEAVEVVFDPSVISFGEILRVFFSVAHDPTELNRQGSDVGPQYRSHIYTMTAQQQEVANAYIAQLDAAGIYGRPIVTRVDAFQSFYAAEGYHQDYLENDGAGDPHGPNVGYLRYWDYPKLDHAQLVFPEYWRNSPVLVATTHPNLVN